MQTSVTTRVEMSNRERRRSTRGTWGILLAGVLVAWAWPVQTKAGHPDGDELRESGFEVEVETMEVETDRDRVSIDYAVDSGDRRRARRAGLSLWMGVFTSGRSSDWHLMYALPLVSDDGSAILPRYLTIGQDHVVVRLVAISNGHYLSPGSGLFADGSMYVGVDGQHEDDHSHDGDGRFMRRHVELGHRTTALQSIDMKLSFVGTLHQFGWFAPRFGFHRFHTWFQRQSLLTQQFRRHLRRHHHHTCSVTTESGRHRHGGHGHRRSAGSRTILHRHGAGGR